MFLASLTAQHLPAKLTRSDKDSGAIHSEVQEREAQPTDQDTAAEIARTPGSHRRSPTRSTPRGSLSCPQHQATHRGSHPSRQTKSLRHRERSRSSHHVSLGERSRSCQHGYMYYTE